MNAVAWDGVGPKRECLLRVQWQDSSGHEWVHFDWRDADASGYNDGEGEYSSNPDEYHNDSASITIRESSDGWMHGSGKFDEIDGADFTITHWADVPEMPQ